MFMIEEHKQTKKNAKGTSSLALQMVFSFTNNVSLKKIFSN
jgi:hypothetical protein